MEFLPVVCLCLLSCSGTTSAAGNEPVKEVEVDEGSDAILPCSFSDKRNLENVVFEWKKDGQRKVFFYDAGVIYNDALLGPDEQFRGRVSHFEDELKNGVASIKINNTRLADSGFYTCDFPHLQPKQTFYIKLVVGPVVVTEGSDVILPCSLSTDITAGTFDWKKDGQDVFLYDTSSLDGRPGPNFTGRVSHFKDELKNGNASITIRNTKVADSGDYTCDFPRLQPRQTFHIQLSVAQVLKDRSKGNIPGAARKPSISTLDQMKTWALLQCEADGSPPPSLQWQDSSGNNLTAEEPQSSDRGGRSYVTVKITVTKTDNYSCVAVQETIRHKIAAVTFVRLDDPVEVVVKEDSEAILPCSLSDKRDLEDVVFDWKRDYQKGVFKYDAGVTYNDGLSGQDEQFRGRVSHFEDELKNGVASIKIQNTRLTDSGDYTCIFPNFQPRQIFNIKLVVGPVVVTEDSEVILPCSLSTDITADVFDWKKNGQDVFLYTGSHEHTGQQFTGRVSHFPDELKNGNASIIIRNTKVADSGDYTCHFPRLQPRQIFHIRLVVDQVLRDRSKDFEGAAQPDIDVLAATKDWFLLQCEAHGVAPLTVEWQDSAKNKLQAEKPEISERGGQLYITVKITVTKTENYRCVATQENISHQTVATIPLYIKGRVVVAEGSDVILACSLSTDIMAVTFDWKKDGQDVFLYDIDSHNGRPGPEFTGRISHFKDELKNGNASIIIRNTKRTDSGDYTCDFPRRQPKQTFHIRLDVGQVLKDRSEEKIKGAAAKPYVKTLHRTKDQAVLQCEVHGAFPKPEVVWMDSSGNIITSEAPQVNRRRDRYDIILKTTVTKTGRYRCVVTQKQISHQTESFTYVHFYGPTTSESGSNTGSILAGFFGGVLVCAAVFVLRWLYKRHTMKQNSQSPPPGTSEMENLNST